MSVKSIHQEIRTKTALAAGALASAAGQTGKIIDRQGYGGVEFIVCYGAVTATDATIPVIVKSGTATNALASVADTYLDGTETLAALGQATRTSGTGKNVTKRVGYVGNDRYVQFNLGAATVSAGVKVAAVAVLHSPQLAPQTNP